jgi:hypothetical protein
LILIDALDEGDPPEQQVAGFKGDVMAGGNKALALVVRLLVEMLPTNVRYFVWVTQEQIQAMYWPCAWLSLDDAVIYPCP